MLYSAVPLLRAPPLVVDAARLPGGLGEVRADHGAQKVEYRYQAGQYAGSRAPGYYYNPDNHTDS
jgi:hypothetical protein